MDLDKLTRIHGNSKVITTPSLLSVAIREQNGEDDDVISSTALLESGDSFDAYIAGIIVGCDDKPDLPQNMQEVKKLRPRDKAFILLSSRVFSLGAIVNFIFNWGDVEFEYTEDLSQYLWDYNHPFPSKPTDDHYHKYRIPPFISPEQRYFEFELQSGKYVSYNVLTSKKESEMASLPMAKLTINAEIKARDFRLMINDTWEKVENFKMFSGQDMREIRTHIDMFDKRYDLLTDIKNPNTGEYKSIPLLGIPDFFYPRLT